MAASFIEHQRVSKRRDRSHLSKKSAFSAVDFTRLFKQKPKQYTEPRLRPFQTAQETVFRSEKTKYRENIRQNGRESERKNNRQSILGKIRKSVFTGFFGNIRNIREKTCESALDGVRDVRKSGFSFPIPSLMTMAVVAGTLLISLVALNWEGLDFSTPDTRAISPVSNRGSSAQSLINYANTGIVAFVPFSREVQADSALLETQAEAESYLEMSEIPLDLIPDFEWHTYRVQRGDSVSRIAVRFGISMDAVIASNGIENARRLREGQILRIPNMDGIPHTVRRGETLSGISNMHNVPESIILDVNDIRSNILKEGETLFIPGARMAPDALRLSLGEQFIFPVARDITSGFGWRPDPFTGRQSFHRGIDLRGSIGTPVRAAKDGTVARLGNSRVYGQYIIMTHAGGFQTLYAHLSSFSVRQGDRVRQGAVIGAVGNTGMSTGPHLHFGIHRNGNWVNPIDFLQ